MTLIFYVRIIIIVIVNPCLLSLIFDQRCIRAAQNTNNSTFLIIVYYDLAVQVASKSLMDTLNEMYETQWVGHDHMCTDSNNLDMLWSDYTHKLADQVLIPLNTYQAQFAETRVSDIFLTIVCTYLQVLRQNFILVGV